MKLTEINKTISILKMDENQKDAILKLIEIKTDNDMEKVLTEIKRLEDKQDTKFSMIFWAIGLLIGLIVALKVIN